MKRDRPAPPSVAAESASAFVLTLAMFFYAWLSKKATHPAYSVEPSDRRRRTNNLNDNDSYQERLVKAGGAQQGNCIVDGQQRARKNRAAAVRKARHSLPGPVFDHQMTAAVSQDLDPPTRLNHSSCLDNLDHLRIPDNVVGYTFFTSTSQGRRSRPCTSFGETISSTKAFSIQSQMA